MHKLSDLVVTSSAKIQSKWPEKVFCIKWKKKKKKVQCLLKMSLELLCSSGILTVNTGKVDDIKLSYLRFFPFL